ncbi:pseudouridine synthase [Piedraia hortae CBS 480.64]|uniref:Pseudouridine synthase n=1 Tax=Piedraia hortae CBS 480.64 TaxID=1314780 RepID=A0A6A7C6L6_9PEZI|nr:pseudouridine synthase [Piedraia hortae CBS 480.64]
MATPSRFPSEPDTEAETTTPAVVTTPCDPWPRPYIFDSGLRRVAPYHYTYNTNAKERWRGKPLLEIFTSEFRDRPEGYYQSAINDGKIHINGRPGTATTIIRNGDIISHTLHRHEPPVTAQPIGIIHEDDDLLVINKPAGVPVHPAGRYNYNSVVEILRAERAAPGWNPLPCNRLDRLTSGVMFIAKHKKAAEILTNQLTTRTVRKEYLARVRGTFPPGPLTCDQPILQISPKLGLNRVRASGKSAKTLFIREASFPTYSIVRCLPLTGRTHQIRVHLQYLGHPISNDPIYANRRVFGANLGKASTSDSDDEDIMTRLSKMGKEEVADAVAYETEMREEYQNRMAERLTGEKCEVCGTELYSDPGPHELGIYLHALRYRDEGGRWEYEAPRPEWAVMPGGEGG